MEQLDITSAARLVEELAEGFCRDERLGFLHVFTMDTEDEVIYTVLDEQIHKVLAAISGLKNIKMVRVDITALPGGPSRAGRPVPPVCASSCAKLVADLLAAAAGEARRYRPVILSVPWFDFWTVDSTLTKLLDAHVAPALPTRCMLAVATARRGGTGWAPVRYVAYWVMV